MSTTAKHFSPRASLAALGLRLRRLGLFEAIAAHVHIPQKTVKHTPAEKLYDAFVAILSGAHGLSEINTRLLADGLRELLHEQLVVVSLGGLSD